MSVAYGGSSKAVRVVRVVSALYELTKPNITMLVLLTGVPALLMASPGLPDAWLFFGTCAGIVFASASAASFNHYFDRDIDALMRRTRTRPLPAGVLPPSAALGLAFVLAAAAWVSLITFANALAALIAVASIVYYAVFYTIWLKRLTPQNIVIGGGAGASAPLIAWAAVTGGSTCPPSCSRPSCSCGRRRTSGRCRSTGAMTTRVPASRCFPSRTVRPRPGNRS